MNKAEETFLVILKDILHPTSELSDLPSQDWASIFDVSKKQNIFPLLYDVAENYLSFKSFDSANPQYFSAATASMTVQMKKTEQFIDLYRSFLSAGLAPIVMKGIICRSLYDERSDFRPSGDEDILIDKKDYGKVVEVLTACGYRNDEQPDKALKVVQEVTFCSPNIDGEPVLTVELHLNPFGSDATTRDKMNRWFDGVFQTNETVVIQNTSVRTMTPTDHFLFLVYHAFKHFSFCGFGIRMMLDILLFAEKYGDRIDWKYIDKALEDVGACGFLADLICIGNEYLGFNFSQFATFVSPQDLLEDMFRAGTFGIATETDHTAGRIIADVVQTNSKRKNKYTSYMRLLFPSWKTWTPWKPYLSDKPWMLPIEWVKRVVRYLRGETSTSNLNDIDKSYELAENRLALLKKYGVI